MGTFNPEMMILARDLAGLTQGELAGLASISQAEISKIESGVRVPSEDQIAIFAKHLKSPIEFFYLPDSVRNFGTACVYHRKRQSTTQGVLRRLLAIVNKRRIQVRRLLNAVEISDDLFPRLDVDEHPGGPEEVARKLRAAWKLPPGPVNNMTKAIEDSGGIVLRFDFETNKVDAVSQWVVGSPPLFFVNSAIPADRMRFSLAHEVGHIVMHQLPTDDMEREADRFASEFLMPKASIIGQLDEVTLPRLAALKPHWKTSMGALLKRAGDLGTITERRKNYLWFRMGQLGYKSSEPVSIPLEFPTLLAEVIELHRRDLNYSISDLARLLMTTEEEISTEFLPAQTKLRLLSR